MKRIIYLFAFVIMASLFSCTDLDEDINELQKDNTEVEVPTNKDDSSNPNNDGGGDDPDDTEG